MAPKTSHGGRRADHCNHRYVFPESQVIVSGLDIRHLGGSGIGVRVRSLVVRSAPFPHKYLLTQTKSSGPVLHRDCHNAARLRTRNLEEPRTEYGILRNLGWARRPSSLGCTALVSLRAVRTPLHPWRHDVNWRRGSTLTRSNCIRCCVSELSS